MVKNVQCICEICCCGRHKCPHRPKATEPWGPCVMSEYAAEYQPRCGDRVTAIKVEPNLTAGVGLMSDRTTNRADYVPHSYEAPYKHTRPPYKAPEGEMEKSTIYQNEYTQKQCPPQAMIKPFELKRCPAKFDGQPTYRSDYRQWDSPPSQLVKPKNERTILPKFDSQAVYSQDYVPHCMPSTQAIRPSNELQMSDAPFKGDTIYRSEYVPQEFTRNEPKKAEEYVKSRTPFEKLTINRIDYTPKEMCPNPPVRPPASSLGEHGPMSDVTTTRTDYRNHGIVVPEQITRAAYRPPDGQQYFDSTYKNDFDTKPLCSNPPVHQAPARRCEGKFNGDTNYKSDYKPWDVKPVEPRKPAEWSPSGVPFSNQTTFQTDYVPHPCGLAPSLIVPKSAEQATGPFDGKTQYRAEFTPKIICPCCPAQFLSKDQSSPDGYTFDHYDEHGHQRYRVVAE